MSPVRGAFICTNSPSVEQVKGGLRTGDIGDFSMRLAFADANLDSEVTLLCRLL